MRKNMKETAKLVAYVESNKETKEIKVVKLHDNRTNEDWTQDMMYERGICNNYRDTIDRSSTEELKTDLNWNLFGDSLKYQFKWLQSGKETSLGMALIFD